MGKINIDMTAMNIRNLKKKLIILRLGFHVEVIREYFELWQERVLKAGWSRCRQECELGFICILMNDMKVQVGRKVVGIITDILTYRGVDSRYSV